MALLRREPISIRTLLAPLCDQEEKIRNTATGWWGAGGNPAMLGGRYASRLPLQENRGPEAEGVQRDTGWEMLRRLGGSRLCDCGVNVYPSGACHGTV